MSQPQSQPQSQRTPGTWTVTERHGSHEGQVTYEINAPEGGIADLVNIGEATRANADYICQAVNAHEALVAALEAEEAAGGLEKLADFDTLERLGYGDGTGESITQFCTRLRRAALKLARGEA